MTSRPTDTHGGQSICELCEAARFTHWYYEDDICWVADCEVCLVPMAVWKQHGVAPSEQTQTHMIKQLREAGVQRFGETEFEIDTVMRQIPDHWHAHARDVNWFSERSRRRLSRYDGVGVNRTER